MEIWSVVRECTREERSLIRDLAVEIQLMRGPSEREGVESLPPPLGGEVDEGPSEGEEIPPMKSTVWDGEICYNVEWLSVFTVIYTTKLL